MALPRKACPISGFFTDAAWLETQQRCRARFDSLNSPLFTDYADKYRYIYVPRGRASSSVDPDLILKGLLKFPVGSAIIKSFGYEI